MSLYGMMRTGISGMAAQVNRLSATADNIANSGTTGYKRSRAEFATLVLSEAPGSYNSGGVTTTVQTSVSAQGVLTNTTSVTDLAVNGDGFFVVQSSSGTPFLTRAGAFVPNASGELVNAAGYKLMGYSLASGAPTATANGFEGLQPVVLSSTEISAAPSTEGNFFTNLPSDAPVVAAANLPAANAASAEYTAKSSLIAYDNLGQKILLDVYSTKTAANTWQVAVFNKANAGTGAAAPFPYSSGPLATQTLSFSGTTGKLTTTSADSINIPVPSGKTLKLDLSGTSQFAKSYSVQDAQVDGNAPSAVGNVEIAKDGTIYAMYDDGSTQPIYRVPLATTQSPDRMLGGKGNVYTPSSESGAVRIGFPGESGFGAVASGQLENSNVDVAEELTTMIESQRSYTANSKVFQTGSELMDIIVNLKR
jgi:flagellar hook protein FlgE